MILTFHVPPQAKISKLLNVFLSMAHNGDHYIGANHILRFWVKHNPCSKTTFFCKLINIIYSKRIRI